MLFTRLRLLKNASDFGFELISDYDLIALGWLDPIRQELNDDAWQRVKRIAEMDPRVLYVFGESRDDPVEELVGEFWLTLAKRIDDIPKDTAALGLVETSRLQDLSAEILRVRWVAIEIDMDPEDELDRYAAEHSPEGYALIRAVKKGVEIGKSEAQRKSLIDTLGKIWMKVGLKAAGGL